MAPRPEPLHNNFLHQYAPRTCLMESTHMAQLRHQWHREGTAAEGRRPSAGLSRTCRSTDTGCGCSIGQYGACSVHFDGEVLHAPAIPPFGQIAGGMIVTMEEGCRPFAGSHAEGVGWRWDIPRCGYCRPGQIGSLHAPGAQPRSQPDSDIDDAMTPDVCNCCTMSAHPRVGPSRGRWQHRHG